MKKIILIFMALSCISCTTPQTQDEYLAKKYSQSKLENTIPKENKRAKSFILSATQEEEAKSKVLTHLKDPNSAIFSRLIGYEGYFEGEYSVCGFVNSKNSFGGYTGNTMFAVYGYNVYFQSTGDNSKLYQACGSR